MKHSAWMTLALLVSLASVAAAQPATTDTTTIPVPTPTPVPGQPASETPTPAPTAATPAPAATGFTAGSHWLGIIVGVGMPFGDFANKATTGYHLGFTYDHMLHDDLAVGGDIEWHKFGGNDDLEKEKSIEFGTPAQVTTRFLPVTGHVKLYLPATPRMRPFVRGALGAYSIKETVDAGGKHETSATRFGFQIGAGAELNDVGPVRWGVDVRYHYVATSGSAANMVSASAHVIFGLH